MLKFRFLIIIVLACYASSFSQTGFTFTVVDQKTKAPIPFCYVIIKGKNVSAQSNENGSVNIKAKDNDTLVIYQLGYMLLKTNPSLIEKNNFTVSLVSKNIVLDEVIVTTKNLDTFMYKNDVVFLDFDFYDDQILTLANKGGKYNTLMLVDQNGNKIAEKKLNIETESIFKDCFDNMHVITKDSIYQVYYDYQDIVLLPPFHIRNYYGLLKPCECYHSDKFIFKEKKYRDLKNVYYLFEGQKQAKKTELAIIADSISIKGFNMDFDIRYFLNLRRHGLGYATSVSELNKYIDELREAVPLPSNYLLKPVESEMKKLDSSFVLFDYTNKFVHTYSLNGKLKAKQLFPNTYDILPKLIIDHDAHTYLFSNTSKSGVITLYRYDAGKNVFTHKFELNSFYFLRVYKIKGNNLFFIYKDRQSTGTKTKILKQYIKWQKL